jgi:hypothetical protein
MADFYAEDDGKSVPQARELFKIYDTLAELFGRRSEFDMDDSKINEIYDAIIQGQKIEQMFEGSLVENFNDLMKMEKVKRNDKINALINKMDTFEEIEAEN